MPPVRAVSGALKQLVRLLLTGASAWAPTPVRVGTEKQGDGVQLVIEIAASSARENAPPGNADTVLWNHLNELERLAAQSLLRQLEGALRVEARPGGCSLRVRWNACPPD